MDTSVFAETGFWLLIFLSVVLPFGIYGVLFVKKAISRKTVMFLGFALVVIAGLDLYLLQHLANAAKLHPSLVGDAFFRSELSLALYLLPAMFAGIGVNLLSHALVRHLVEAEERFEREHRSAEQSASRQAETATETRRPPH